MYRRIVTHNDFDGIVSGALCAVFYDIDSFVFTGPRSITESKVEVTTSDIVCDLPYPLECGMWFDHHRGNGEELELRGIDYSRLPGAFSPEPSCARVIHTYLAQHGADIPPRFSRAVDEADVIDSFDYRDLNDWRKETPGKIIERAVLLRTGSRRDTDEFLQWVIRQVMSRSLEEVAGTGRVEERAGTYGEQEERMLQRISEDGIFLEQDTDRDLVILDLTRHKRRPVIQKNLAFLLHPRAAGVVEIQSLHRRGVKTNDFSVSMSLSLSVRDRKFNPDVGHIMRTMNIGDGHDGAGAGQVQCRSKAEMIREKQNVLNTIFRLWSEQKYG